MKIFQLTKIGQAPLEIGCQRRPTDTRGVLSLTGQAVVELAIFGSLILTGFAVLLSYSQTFREQQALQQQAFRMALRKAYDDNGFVSYNIIKHHRAPNIFSNFKQGNRESISAGSSMMWSKGEAESFSYYQVNEDLVRISTHKEKRTGKKDADVPDEVWNIESSATTDYSGREEKQEDQTKITTGRSANLKDTVTTTLKIKYENTDDKGKGDGTYTYKPDVVFIQGLCADGRYRESCAGDTIGKERTWKTPH
jgi:type II secretory pathway pseudopilin PulG